MATLEAICTCVALEKQHYSKTASSLMKSKSMGALTTLAKLLERWITVGGGLFSLGIPHAFLDPICHHFLRVLEHDSGLFKPLTLVYGRILRICLSKPEYRGLLTPTWVMTLSQLCRTALVHEDENIENQVSAEKRSFVPGEMLEYARILQFLAISYTKDWSAYQGQQAIYFLETARLFFEQHAQETPCHSILMQTVNHILWELGANDLRLSFQFCVKVCPIVLSLWRSKSDFKGPLVAFLKIYFSLMEVQKTVCTLELNHKDLLLSWDCIPKELTSRFGSIPVVTLQDVQKLPALLPTAPFAISKLRFCQTSIESLAFCDFAANVATLIVDFHGSDPSHVTECKTRTGCPRRIFHTDPLGVLCASLVSLSGGTFENVLACQVLFLIAVKYRHRIQDCHLIQLLDRISYCMEHTKNETIKTWGLLTLASLISGTLQTHETIDWPRLLKLVSFSENSGSSLYLLERIVAQNPKVVKSELDQKVWEQLFNRDPCVQSMRLVKTLVLSKEYRTEAFEHSEAKRILAWTLKSLEQPSFSEKHIENMMNILVIMGGQNPLKGISSHQRKVELWPEWAGRINECLLVEYRQDVYARNLEFLSDGPQGNSHQLKVDGKHGTGFKLCIESLEAFGNSLLETTSTTPDLLTHWLNIRLQFLMTSSTFLKTLAKKCMISETSSISQKLSGLMDKLSQAIVTVLTEGTCPAARINSFPMSLLLSKYDTEVDSEKSNLWPLQMSTTRSLWPVILDMSAQLLPDSLAGDIDSSLSSSKRKREYDDSSDEENLRSESLSKAKVSTGTYLCATFYSCNTLSQSDSQSWKRSLEDFQSFTRLRQVMIPDRVTITLKEWDYIRHLFSEESLGTNDVIASFYDSLGHWLDAVLNVLDEGEDFIALKTF